MGLKTFDEWSRTGHRIKKGAKSIRRNSIGVPLFDRTQVWNPHDYSRSGTHRRAYSMSREEDYDMAVAHLGDRDWF